MKKNTAEFAVNLKGEATDRLYDGDFIAKVYLSHADDLARGRMFRELIGANPELATDRDRQAAEILSQLSVRIMKGPDWWVQSRKGMDLCDDNVLADVYEKAMKPFVDDLEERQKKAEVAAKELKEKSSENKVA